MRTRFSSDRQYRLIPIEYCCHVTYLDLCDGVCGQLDVCKVSFAEHHTIHRVASNTLDLLAHYSGFGRALNPATRRRLEERRQQLPGRVTGRKPGC